MRKFSSQNKLLSMNASSSIDSSSWVIHLRSFFEEKKLEDDVDTDDTTVCVYHVPKPLRALKPEAYSPNIIALGPYHHWRQDLYETERYKLICAKKVQKEFKHLKFEDLVKKLLKKEHKIRGCYHKHLDMDGEALAWMIAIDGLFLLEFLHVYVIKISSLASSARMSFLVKSMGRKLAYDLILRDILMLENQIPFFVLKKILRIQCLSSDLAENLLPSMLMGVCRELSPLVLDEGYPMSEAIQCAHLLDLLYHLIVPKLEQGEEEIQVTFLPNKFDEEDPSFGEIKEVFTNSWEMASKLKIISKMPIVSAIAPALESIFLGNKHEKGSSTVKNGSLQKDAQVIPLVEEIMIPSVENLCDAGVEFCPTNGDISTIQFDKKLMKFYLHVVLIDGNTEVLMRNLVAYEASATPCPLVLERYTELMNGIIDTAKDVEILRKKKIIVCRLLRDEEVANLWNGMTKAIRLTKVSFIDKAIEDVNGYFNNTLKRKLHKLTKRYVYNSWRILVVLATLLLLGLMVLQSFCSVYSCPRFFNIDETTTSTRV
ncbi:putative UPF0481 protein At3g02645 [Beta vulgaris subsp. vulgaris]|uniref:putative UPF0481 protein At3g02645 n=1 Tax=Beta vulgaris subsp. vulgaris TaxID=3555 RepID=UPI002548220A|nr:putative UPF0481 protein At3g02645 [Beta vulgaris subsp. vulgaris]